MNQNDKAKLLVENNGEYGSTKSETTMKALGEPKFPIGQLVVTRAVADTLLPREVFAALHRHRRGDWGMVSPDDWRENDASMKLGCRLLSAYETAAGVNFWIITEWDRSITTVLFPHEY